MAQTTPRDSSEPVLLAMSVLAGLQLLFSGAGLGDVIGAKAVFAGTLAVGAATAGIQFWVRGQVTATANVVAQLDPAGAVVAGPALSDVPDGEAVNVRRYLGPPPNYPGQS